jgi:hypothetical protein
VAAGRKLLQGTAVVRVFSLLILCFAFAFPAKAESEKAFVQTWAAANKGKVNVRLADGTRCAVVTATHAVDFAFAAKWQDAVGQALYHASQLNKHPGIVLIMADAKDAVYRQRLDATISVFNLPIDVWEIGAGAAKQTP